MDAPVYRPAERVLIHSYDGQQWTKQASEMSIETKPFANGTGVNKRAISAQLLCMAALKLCISL